ncbi:MAG: trimethylamine methyltransferase [Rhodospirillaceae bacterium]|jgi:trimethylamine--corrinoid protein Co-methyltransferase|nr:trimethylamine methyltransferase [Rhodospirillaceae bacterium]MDP6623605.1 trimethylamine methyltransferase family protein [Alphaproteobacteria bacterium]|tara:strand:+ start:1150 stop:2676 length:1527 start_codon:yes stop_codon:yes gene_type:complete
MNQAKGRRGGREARRAQRERPKTAVLPAISRQLPVLDVLGEEGLEIIEANAETVLAETGIDFRDDDEVLELWRQAGAEVSGERVRLPRGLARKLLETAPGEFTQHARNPERSVPIGGRNIVFAPVYGPPFVRDLEGGRRYATLRDFENLVKLAYLAPAMHHSGGVLCEPVDVPVPERHLDMLAAHIRLSDKPFMGAVTAPERAADSIAMAELVFGADFVADHTVLISIINANSPLVYDATMLGALKTYARANQATIVSPFILSGAMSPVTVAGTLTLILAEALAGMALTQLLRPGAPVVFGAFASSISMQSGAPTFGTPEPTLVLLGAAQLARRLGIPFRSGGSLSAAKIADAQAAYESAQTLLPTLLAGCNFVLHAAGWLEGGLCAGYEKFVLDADQLGMMQVLAGGVDLSADSQAMAAITEVGPGNHFLGVSHTQAHFETAFYRSALADNNSVEQWQDEGSLDAVQRAHQNWQHQLADYQPPALDPAIDEAIADFVTRRKTQLSDT